MLGHHVRGVVTGSAAGADASARTELAVSDVIKYQIRSQLTRRCFVVFSEWHTHTCLYSTATNFQRLIELVIIPLRSNVPNVSDVALIRIYLGQPETWLYEQKVSLAWYEIISKWIECDVNASIV